MLIQFFFAFVFAILHTSLVCIFYGGESNYRMYRSGDTEIREKKTKERETHANLEWR